MSRVSKRKLLKILKGDYDPPSMTRQEVLDFMKRRPTQEEWLRGYRQWKKQMEKDEKGTPSPFSKPKNPHPDPKRK